MAAKKEWLKRPPPRELFFAPLEIDLSPGDLALAKLAYQMAKAGHYRQKREDGSRYFDHPKAAAWIYIDELGGRDTRSIMLHLLHDMQEDSRLLTSFAIRQLLGREIAYDVRAVTKLQTSGKVTENTEQYVERVIAQGPHAVLAKINDRVHNLRTLHSCASEKRKRMCDETRGCHLPRLIGALSKAGSDWQPYAEPLKARIHEALDSVEHD